jgi:hypothetical protein
LKPLCDRSQSLEIARTETLVLGSSLAEIAKGALVQQQAIFRHDPRPGRHGRQV